MEKRKLTDGSYRYRETSYIKGKKKIGPWFKKVSDAKTWKNRIETEKMTKLAQGEYYVEVQNVYFKEYAENWLEKHVKVNCAYRSYESYESVLRVHIMPVFGKMLLKEITEDHGINFIQKIKSEHNARGVRNIWQVLRTIIIKALKERLIFFNPLINIKLPKPDLALFKFWVPNDIRQYLGASSTVVSPIFHITTVAVQTGMRLAELCGLCWDRVDFVRNLIHVTRTRDKSGLKDLTKNKLARTIPMTKIVRAILMELYEQRNPDCEYVFTDRHGKPLPYGHIYRLFALAQKSACITNKIRFHDLRHTFASNYMMSGGNIFDLQKLLGHTKIEMTMIYAHLSPEHLQNSLQFMGDNYARLISVDRGFSTSIAP